MSEQTEVPMKPDTSTQIRNLMHDGMITTNPIPHRDDPQMNGVVFTLARAEALAPHRLHDTGRADIVHVSTDDLTRTAHIRRALIARIAEAKRKVLFCSFLFADDEIVRALCEASERLHGGVYVLTSLDKHLRADVLELDADMDANAVKHQERAKRHDEHLRRLAHAGAWVRSAEDCHAKFCVVDDACTIVTSANATQEAYESNPEDGLLMTDPRVAREFGRLFAHVWQHLTALESTPGSHLDVHSRRMAPVPPWRKLSSAGAVRPAATLRRAEHSLQSAAIDVIDRAHDHLAIATYSFMGMEDHPVGKALARALARGVRIALLVQPRNHIDAQRAALAWLVALAPSQVRVYGHRRTHTKSIVADREIALLWTGNLDGRHGWDDGVEVGAVVEDAGVAAAVAGWIGDVMARATHTASMALQATEPAPGDPSAESVQGDAGNGAQR
ncbi:hypothetical protein PUN4_370091 [Paraburkholderia unamae]|uniref:phospholipase D-like domain-containing protein n=1 Tax=Paraburkholderia unamae TaxID=219649 RepID=UPI001CB36FF2|nr:phospholipase D-like domain-containing protein [Paraburkholderia unamae]CAG9261406.1 hypothetical protein PUN4_370091 [Paraburkholderia unamae]